jgi:hypothetical protein
MYKWRTPAPGGDGAGEGAYATSRWLAWSIFVEFSFGVSKEIYHPEVNL